MSETHGHFMLNWHSHAGSPKHDHGDGSSTAFPLQTVARLWRSLGCLIRGHRYVPWYSIVRTNLAWTGSTTWEYTSNGQEVARWCDRCLAGYESRFAA